MNGVTRVGLSISPDGQVVIPERLRAELNGESGRLVATVENGALILEPIEVSIRRAQELVRKYIPEGVSLADEFIADRRAEAAREDAEIQAYLIRS